MLDNIRYVHFNEMFRKWNGFTIAYSRNPATPNYINFAVALVKHTDQYDKSVGRLVSTQRLELLEPDIETRDDYFDSDNLVGNITVDSLVNLGKVLNFDSILADQTIGKLNMMDFKHSFISTVLVELVTDKL